MSFSKPPQCILRETVAIDGQNLHPGGEWLPGAYVNPVKNCLSLNTKRSLDDTMIIWRDEGKDDLTVSKMTLEELQSEVWYATFFPIIFLIFNSCSDFCIDSLVCCYCFLSIRSSLKDVVVAPFFFIIIFLPPLNLPINFLKFLHNVC